MKIAILDDYTNAARASAAFDRLAGHEVDVWTDPAPPLEQLAERLKDVEAIILIRERTQIREPLLARLPKLRMISHLGPFPNVDAEACARRGVMLCDGRATIRRLGGAGVSSTAELTWALILASMRQLPQQVAALKAGAWQLPIAGRTLQGKTLGVYGYGGQGTPVAGYGRAFGMDVQVWGREGSQGRAAADGFRIAASKESLLATSDVVTIHLRAIPETNGIVTAADLALMKPDAVLVNTSRARLIESGALEAALKAGRPGAAAVDVFEHEPVTGGGDPLLQMDNVICTPHLGYATVEQLEAMLDILIDQVVAYAEGRPVSVV